MAGAGNDTIKTAYIAVTDYAPGLDSLEAFKVAFTKAGGKVVDEVRMPVTTTDFGPYVQKIRDEKPDAVFMFTPFGAPGIAFIKTYLQMGLDQAGIKLLATGETNESDLRSIGDRAVGVISAFQYSPYLDNELNKKFLAAYQAKYGADQLPNYSTVSGYDGMRAMADVVAKLGPDFNPDEAMKLLRSWKGDSPRGTIYIDPEEGDIVQDMYIRRVEKREDGTLVNVAFDKVPEVKDLWKVLNPK